MYSNKTRHLVFFYFIIALFATIFIPRQATAAPNLTSVMVNGEEIAFPDTKPQIINDRVFVPVRGVFDAMGFDVDWDPSTSTASLTRGANEIIIRRGVEYIAVNGTQVEGDASPQIINNRFMIPLRLVSEAAGASER